MDVSRNFLDILHSINYYVGHLHKDLFANEEQHPELLSIFMWLINNISPKSNCITPKDLKLYTSISSKCDNYLSLEKVSQAIDKFYDESTKDSVICSTDLESLEKEILKSQQELNDLNLYGTLYEKKNELVDQEISLLREKEDNAKLLSHNAEIALEKVLGMFTDTIDTFGSAVNKLNDHIINSLKNEENSLIQLSSKNLEHLINLWREHIFEMVHTWFNEENNMPETNDTNSSKLQMLIYLYKSVKALRSAEMIEQFEIAKLNILINNISTIQNYYNEDHNYILQDGLDLTNYLAKYVRPCEISIHSNDHSEAIKYADLQSCMSDVMLADTKQKCSELESVNACITHLHDSIEHYIIMCDVLWCLIRTNYSMTNLNCELVLRCTEIFDKMIEEIAYVSQWNSNQTDKQQSDVHTAAEKCITSNFDGSKCTFNICINSDEMEKISEIIHQWKSKLHFSRNECNRLVAIEEKLQMYNNTLKELFTKT